MDVFVKQNHGSGASSSSVPSSIELSVSRIESSSFFDQSGQQQQLESTNYCKPTYDQLLLAMQELQRQLNAKEAEIRSLKTENEELKCDLKEMRGDLHFLTKQQQQLQIEDVDKEKDKDEEQHQQLPGGLLQLKYEKEIEYPDNGDCEMLMVIKEGVAAAPQGIDNSQEHEKNQEEQEAAGQNNDNGDDDSIMIIDDDTVNNNNDNNGHRESKKKAKQEIISIDEKDKNDAEEENDRSATNIPKFDDIEQFKKSNSEYAKKYGKSSQACNICGKWKIPIPRIKRFGRFSTPGSLTRHFKRYHWSKAPLTCDICGFIGLNIKHYLAHQERHKKNPLWAERFPDHDQDQDEDDDSDFSDFSLPSSPE